MIKSEEIPLFPKDTEERKLSKTRQVVVLVACMYLHFISLGFTTSLGVVYVELIRYFDSQRSLAALVQSLYQGLTYMLGLVFASLVAKYGPGWPVMVASLCSSLAIVISVFSPNIYMVIICIGVVCGMCMSINFLSAFVAVGWTFTTHRRAALAGLTMATAIGQTVLPNAVNWMITSYGWTGSLLISSGLFLNSMPCGIVLHLSRKEFKGNNQSNDKTTDRVFSCISKLDAAFYIFLVVNTTFPGLGAVESWFTVDLATQRGYTREAGTFLLSLVGLFGLFGRLIGTLLLKIVPGVRLSLPMAFSFEVFAVAHFLVIYLTSYSGMLGGIVLRGLSAGALMCFQPGIILELRGIHRFPRTVAFANFMSGGMQVVAGYVGGVTADLTGGYEVAFYTATGSAVINGICLIFVWILLRRM